MKHIKYITSYVIALIFVFNSIGVLGQQDSWELYEEATEYFSEDFESYETTMLDSPVRPDGYAYNDRVTNAYGGTSKIIYTANAADNIPVFNNNRISDKLSLYQNTATDEITVSGRVEDEYIGRNVTLLVTKQDFNPTSPEASKIIYIKESSVENTGTYKFVFKWAESYGEISDHVVKIYAGGITDIVEETGEYITPLVVLNSSASEFKSEIIGDGVYKAEGPDGNVLYGGLDGFYGWYGGGLFENYPDPYNTGFSAVAEPYVSLGHKEKRLAVINEVAHENSSNKLLIMDAVYQAGQSGGSGNGISQSAVFGKHNLDFSDNTQIKFRLYPYQVGGSAQGFKMYLTRGRYNMEYEPVFMYDSVSGLSCEYHTPDSYKGSYFPEEDKYELFRLTDSDLTGGEGVYMFRVAGAENRTSGYEKVSPESTPPTTATKNEQVGTLSADVYYDITFDIDRYGSVARLYAEVKDSSGDVVFTTAPNGVAWEVPELASFLEEGTQYGIVFEAHSSKYSGSSARTKVGIDNLEFFKKDYVVRNAWLASENGEGNINFDVYNYSGNEIEACLVGAIYERTTMQLSGALKTSVKLSAQPNPQENLLQGKFALPENFDPQTHIVKLFVWRDNTLAPRMEAVEVHEVY